MEILLNYNVFSFNNQLYFQKIGAPMGSAPVPYYANIFMDKRIDKKLKQLLEALKTENAKMHKNFSRGFWMTFF